jgi:hypothetical protein
LSVARSTVARPIFEVENMMNSKCRTKRANKRTGGVIQLLCVDGEKKKK